VLVARRSNPADRPLVEGTSMRFVVGKNRRCSWEHPEYRTTSSWRAGLGLHNEAHLQVRLHNLLRSSNSVRWRLHR
jgi:hypothetical protein